MKRRAGRLLLVTVAIAFLGTLGAAARPAATPLRVGLVIAVGPRQGADGQIRRFFLGDVARLGVSGRVVYLPPSFVATGPLTELARQRYDLIVTGCNVDPALVGPVAARFPEARFFMPCFDYDMVGKHKVKNVEGVTYRSEEASYLAGFLAVGMEKQRSARDVISSVGGYKFPPIDAFIAGYQAGARHADPSVITLNGYAQDFVDPAKCRSVATAQIAQGSGVVFGVAGACSIGALRAAHSSGVWGIGVDDDQSSLGPFILTSVLKRVDVALFDGIRLFTRGQLRMGGDEIYDLRNGGVALGKISPRVPSSLLRRLVALRLKIVDRMIRVPSTIK